MQVNSGAHRAIALRDYKKEFNIEGTPRLDWGLQDQFFVHDGHAYYHKPSLERYVNDDVEVVEGEKINGVHIKKPVYDEIVKFLGYEVPRMTPQPDLDFMREALATKPRGLPEFVGETEYFFKFKLDGVRLRNITIDDFTKRDLDGVYEAVHDDYNPFLTPYFSQSIYHSGTRYYCMDILAYYYNPKAQFGMFLDPTEGINFDVKTSKKYKDATQNCYFFPFRELTPEERHYAKLLGKLHTAYPNETIIVEYADQDD